jgi:phosphatidylserine/phosphatidylglycerophosphate/cardiolipin synthase-like enzyme
MLALSSLHAVLDALQTARRIDAKAYTLHGPVLRALEAAGRRGAVVNVELAKDPFDDRRGRLRCENRRVAAELRENGVRATLVRGEHAKTIAADSMLYLDAKNWNLGDLIVAEDDPARAAAIPAVKHAALEEERRLIEGAARSDDAIVESESFGCCNAVYAALERLARKGAAPRLLVCERELRGNRRERAALHRLAREGVRVRITSDSEKLAACGDGAWLGSANATVAIPGDENADWGTQTREPAIAVAVRKRLEERWQSARAYQ